ncbi:MAG TPA: hypothetical protein PK678_07420, partial [Ferruginibacter sp.]|nr:hypothetical protein [Ferruginibacter sp.]
IQDAISFQGIGGGDELLIDHDFFSLKVLILTKFFSTPRNGKIFVQPEFVLCELIENPAQTNRRPINSKLHYGANI